MKGTIVNGVLIGVTQMPTARYWLLWPGLAMMLAASFTELITKSVPALKILFSNLFNRSKLPTKSINTAQTFKDTIKEKGGAVDEDVEEDEDHIPRSELVPASWWIPGLILSIVLSITVMKFGFNVGIFESLLAVILGFIFAFIGLQSAGETDMNPTGTIAKASQIVLSALPPFNPVGEALMAKQSTSLIAGLVSASAASQAVDMVSDLKTGHLIGASPKAQFYGQAVGSLIGAIIGLGFWKIFTLAYPCIVSQSITADSECSAAGFGLQAVSAWQGMTIALTQSNSIPESALIAAGIFGTFTIIIVCVKNFYIPQKDHWYVPSMSGIGIAFVNTDPSMFVATFIGGLISLVWKRKSAAHHNMYMYAIASGLIAGEGIFGLIQAGLSVGKIAEGSISRIGMPPRR